MTKVQDVPMIHALSEIVDIMSQTYSRDISVYEESFLAKTIGERLTKTSIKTADEYPAYLLDNPAEAQLLARSLNIAHSEFFRNTLTFALLEKLVLPRIISERRKRGSGEIRIWSAGCAAGQEAYSLAMLLTEIEENRRTKVPFRIFATDISNAGLAVAQKGVYDARTLNNVSLKHVQKYFTCQGSTYTINPSLADYVSFSHYDLLDKHTGCPPESIYGGFDLVFCSNVLYYYKPEIQQFILSKLYSCLSDNGLLISDEAEKAIIQKYNGFSTIPWSAAIFQKSLH